MLRKLIISWLLFILTLIFVPLDIYQALIAGIFIFCLVRLIDNFGKEIIFLDLISLITVTQWLLGPLLYDLMGLKMAVPYDSYYEFALPSTLAFLVGLHLVTWKKGGQRKYIPVIRTRLTEYLSDRSILGVTLFAIGLPAWFIQPYVHPAISFIFSLFSYLLFVGLGFILFSNLKWKLAFITLGCLAIVYRTLLNGMIGTLVFWLIVFVSMYVLRRPLQWGFVFKTFFLLLGLWIVAILQSAKTEYRMQTWLIKRGVNGAEAKREIRQDIGLFTKLVVERILDPPKISNSEAWVLFAARINQGATVSLAMKHVPAAEPYAKGEVTILNTVTAFIPRALWPSKPSIGTADYFKRFTGVRLTKYNSVTLGALGDAYVDFAQLSFLLLFALGLIVSSMFTYFFYGSLSKPTLILWFLILYYSSITFSEISVPGYINSVFKVLLFIVSFRFFMRKFLRLNF